MVLLLLVAMANLLRLLLQCVCFKLLPSMGMVQKIPGGQGSYACLVLIFDDGDDEDDDYGVDADIRW